MLTSQKHLFSLDPEITYLNNAYRGPMLKSSEEAALEDLEKMRNPHLLRPEDFFSGVEVVKTLFGKLVNCPPIQVAVIPSTSYGFACVLNNWNPGKRKKAITVTDEFPSGYFSLQRWADEHDSTLVAIGPELSSGEIGKSWNDRILNEIDGNTGVVLISSVHWMNGVRFDLKQIGQRCREVGACFVVDGTQSVGAMPIDVIECQVDALICATYKWLLGPYSVAMAYFSERFNSGKPLEESWMNRTSSHNFSALTNYQPGFLPGANRYSVGETSHFILLPILEKALLQLLEWNPTRIQEYAGALKNSLVDFQNQQNLPLEVNAFISNHLFSLPISEGQDLNEVKRILEKERISVSVRGSSLRVSINVFNEQKDLDHLIGVLGSLPKA
ncbi:aminotransferase class V-fold PLP-dependent enzyme [Algoriphagus lacus]|uniref:Aminotransferase class V-fold PLP-dependent enzyme n=1 Tax=Algoriphagus lacus TaxID=2056311 RepID=A0A418PMS1_9BACT|nr:aminotransferase class V-fold PLP-dependent enzyme [Algoriphagus lacus]RIW12933.1 aminotransferase class V-fold PLP-dependent enzyme [Algoriphagus lacus]